MRRNIADQIFELIIGYPPERVKEYSQVSYSGEGLHHLHWHIRKLCQLTGADQGVVDDLKQYITERYRRERERIEKEEAENVDY